MTEYVIGALFALGYFVFSCLGIVLGTYVYWGRSAPVKLARYPIKAWLYAPLPIGTGFVLIGVAGGAALLLPKSSALLPMLVAIGAVGFVSVAAGLMAIYVHPDWIRPHWLRGPIGD